MTTSNARLLADPPGELSRVAAELVEACGVRAPPGAADADGGGEPPPWLHLDLMAYNTASRPGRPEGGEAMGVRALFALLRARFG